MNTLDAIKTHQLIAIIRGANEEDILPIGQALQSGGVKLVEVTLNTANALAGIRRLKEAFGDEMKIGAGTVLDPESAKASIDAGADFILAPSVKLETIQLTKRYGKVSIPGAFTPTEIVTAFENGADLIKVFPASVGAQYFKDLKGPLPHIPLVPTGGVNETNIQAFKQAGATAFGIGSSLVDTKQEVTEDYLDALTKKAAHFVKLIQ
ncbi:4-hydroxy-2-oxoglutarate aldolase [Bacillus sp. JCM 19046]|nr:4-hydroxy-2-oxoglutarate aldolase [Bacillus sp. JCM 19045]GAF19283.1 4-hydroxy-2-oxoglutarate aldolase [Bacillus sp. JCM 19046]